ncbi:MAG: hypothetical protein DMG00_07870 [Acidobacteria bacterium]|nr:MAG: hypothetical protein DMG00_07870 [Acidobacteriota bacterium]
MAQRPICRAFHSIASGISFAHHAPRKSSIEAGQRREVIIERRHNKRSIDMIRVPHPRLSLRFARLQVLGPTVATCAFVLFAAGNASAQLAANQTHGFGRRG